MENDNKNQFKRESNKKCSNVGYADYMAVKNLRLSDFRQ